MLVNIDIDVIDNEPDFRNLDHLLMLFEKEQHEWYIISYDADTIMSRSWPSQLSARHQSILHEILKKAIVNSANISKKEQRDRGIVQITRSGPNRLEMALNVLVEPLLVVVENETSDSFFLNRLFEIFPVHGNALKKANGLLYLDYYPSGGRNEVVKTIKNLFAKKEAPYKPRLFIFIDSDKQYPGQPNDAKLQEIIDHCSNENIPIHVLYKREIENYLPLEVLEKRIPATHASVLEEFVKLNSDQLDFFDLEKGFNNNQPLEDDPLFSGFSGRKNVEYNKLRRGFMIDKDFKPKRELYTYFDDDYCNAKNLNNRCLNQPDRDELLNLLLRIKNNL